MKTNVFFFDRPDDGKGTKSVWFYELTNDGFELKQTRRPIEGARSQTSSPNGESVLPPRIPGPTVAELFSHGCDLSARNPNGPKDHEHTPALELLEAIRNKEQRVLDLLDQLQDLLEVRND